MSSDGLMVKGDVFCPNTCDESQSNIKHESIQCTRASGMFKRGPCRIVHIRLSSWLQREYLIHTPPNKLNAEGLWYRHIH